ncbi:polysaccharide pyruvyl transferase family protein [Geminocystis sp. NIES-3709]|uniref:polysaccharide pyruvyl transferase family protein n=1 Tax=Geminocystis sp. NIES-3709 TaxID=1617448 RepID=UPI0005FC9165|nr:polysaccharide pyruvyl transferase family protein [Geminocystis sp. NIES-3709]BAQ64484.1 hypothetical protein GM3709_1249 [Geminocystis sp. NIES-3709]
MKNLLYILRNFQSENYGDLLINDYLIGQLSIHSRVDILYLKSNFDLLQQMTCLQSPNVKLIEWDKEFDRKFFLSVLLKKSFYQYICLIPGHSRYQGLKSRIVQLKNSFILLFLQSLGIKCIWVCKSLDTLPALEQVLEKFISKYIHRYSVRDSLTNINNHLNAEVWPDLAFLMPPNEQKIKSLSSKIIFSFRGDRGEVSEKIIENFCSIVIQKTLEKSNLNEIIFLGNVTLDVPFMKALSDRIRQQFSITVKLVDNLDLINIVNLYDENSLVFTDRLHVALPAMINKTPAFPFIDLSLDTKILGIYKDMGWDEFIIPRPTSVDQLSELSNVGELHNTKMSEVVQTIEKVRINLSSKIAKIFS